MITEFSCLVILQLEITFKFGHLATRGNLMYIFWGAVIKGHNP